MTIRHLPPQRSAPVHEALARLRSEHDVIMLVRDFVARIGPDDWAALPPACRPTKFVDGDDVVDFAFSLATHHCEPHRMEAAGIHARLSSFFTDAAQRIGQIRAAQRMDVQESA